MKEKRAKRIRLIMAVLKFALLIAIVAAVPLFIYFRYPDLLSQFDSLESVNAFLDQYQAGSLLIYIALQVVQIVISVIPGQAIQLAAGYAYPLLLGYGVTILGIAIGSTVAFFLAKVLGRDLIHMVFGEERIKKYVKMLNSKKAFVLIFLIFLIPGIPKDVFTYAAGVSEMDVRPFLLISLIGRTPGIIVSLLIGDMFRTGSYVGMVILIIVSIALFILGVIFRNKIFDVMNRMYDRITTKYTPKDI